MDLKRPVRQEMALNQKIHHFLLIMVDCKQKNMGKACLAPYPYRVVVKSRFLSILSPCRSHHFQAVNRTCGN